MRKHILVGVAGAVSLILVYSGILALTQGLGHALDQTTRLWYWVALLAGGFGIQVGLFSFIRQAFRERRAAATASVAASGGVSAGSMAACCAHHLGDVLPLIGLSGLAVFLVKYQVFFILLGVLSNGVGVTVMLETIQRHDLSPRVARWKWDMNRVRKAAMASSVLILVAAFLLLLR
jgi:hypothetical protein